MNTVREAIRKRKAGQAGFTLIEMAIVLIIIGLVIGAVLKGQDLISNARGKRFASYMRSYEVAEWTYYDRFGTFMNATATLSAQVPSFSPNLRLGSSSFYPRIGLTSTGSRMVLLLCKDEDATLATTFTTDEVNFARALDTAIDTEADAASGKVFAITSGSVWDGTSFFYTVTDDNIAGATANVDWDTTTMAVGYFFDAGQATAGAAE
ncbi:MAG: prepilin-type N-terminal cleavage/methylation domain-containing protein [Desulfovibrionaceae bacterium]